MRDEILRLFGRTRWALIAATGACIALSLRDYPRPGVPWAPSATEYVALGLAWLANAATACAVVDAEGRAEATRGDGA